MKTEKTSNKEKTITDVLTDCGRLKYNMDKTLNIIYIKFPDIDIGSLRCRLTTVGTVEYQAYTSGIDLGDYEVETAMYSDSLSGSKTSVDSHDTLHNLQREKTINDAIRDKFFPDDID